MKFVKEHIWGLIAGIVLYEFYYRSMAKPKGGGA